ncbi:hypothetical protein [Vibrio parahaemolyticus]|uniref:hypothetical protein n=1 Tax=Vibrio parahaemolyticus TaxID=670 RepID=UPI00226DC7F0|nr:hypothetical protein [Vibrio parahaemolyticus]MBE3681789.1 hypothetical protein [Vibrio parahaemolyticus]MDN4708187.1 hypothetical protein [Vibrio parahaemolyticus]MDN4715557.1 hypothetical protein [Vibrio parahaemolyticus]MDN4719567.1 hypothetical protein [Vibrio parahaemolyticus]MDN4723422.1 hypothetical protein [Vibrio parahaemolyticus]
MYIEIESAQRAIPQISFKRDRGTNVIKQSELRLYEDAQTLLESLKGRVDEYQCILEQEVLRLIEEKEQTLNAHIEQVFGDTVESWNIKQNQWLAEAEDKLSALLIEQRQHLLGLKEELKRTVVKSTQAQLASVSQDETLISYLVDVLHKRIDDASRCLKVESTFSDTGVILSVEDDERVICINTSELIAQLREGLDTL